MTKKASYVHPKYIVTFTATLPWLLRWAERFLVFGMKKEKLGKMKGQQFNIVIIDEAE